MLILHNGTLIDGTGHEPVKNAIIIINGSRFENVGSGIDYPKNVELIDLQNLTVLPGLIDSHLHLGGLTVDKPGKAMGKVSFIDMVSFFWDYLRNYTQRRQLAIGNGLTTIRSAGDHYPHIIRLRDNIAAKKLSGPRIYAPGPTITALGGHPASTIYKGNRYIIENAIRQIDDVFNAREEVRRLAESGVDCIKAIYSDINPMDITHKVAKLSLNILEALANETHRYNLKLMVHTGSIEDIMDAVNVGADSIEHGILPGGDSTEFGEELISTMLDRGTYFVPTIAIAWAYKEIYPDFYLHLKKAVKRLHDVGVNIAAGTDSGTPGVVIGKGLHKELELLVEAGLTPMDAIIAATRNAADNLGKGSELGTVEKGKIADMIVISGNPLDDIRTTRDIKMVIKDGVIVVNKF